MKIYLTDEEIEALRLEVKDFSGSVEDYLRMPKTKKGHRESEHTIMRTDGSFFRLRLRQSLDNVLDFTSMICFGHTTSSDLFILCRYNGKSHEHRNKIERGPVFYDFHIHMATQRYQDGGFNEEFFAVVTDRYSNIQEAFYCMASDWNIQLPAAPVITPVRTLFDT